LDDESTWFLVDAMPDPGVVNATTVFVTSQKKKNWKKYYKYGNVQTLFMPLWNWEEIVELHSLRYSSEDTNEVYSLFTTFAGVPRFIFEERGVVDELKRTIASSDLHKILSCIGKEDSDKSISHYLIQIVPTDNYSHQRIDFLSSKIGDMIVKSFEGQRKEELLRFLKDSMEPTFASLASYRGFVFENVAHNLLCKGGKFTIYGPLGGKETESTLDIPKCELKITGKNEISKDNIYYRPVSQTQGAYDSWIGNIGFFQMTTGKEHKISAYEMEQGMSKALLENCVYNKIYFVIPIENYQDFKRQGFKGYGKHDLEKPKKTPRRQVVDSSILDHLQQFVIVIDWKKI